MFESSTLSSVMLSLSLIFSVLLAGYFVVLREWLVQRARTGELAALAVEAAKADLAFLDTLPANQIASVEGRVEPTQERDTQADATSRAL